MTTTWLYGKSQPSMELSIAGNIIYFDEWAIYTISIRAIEIPWRTVNVITRGYIPLISLLNDYNIPLNHYKIPLNHYIYPSIKCHNQVGDFLRFLVASANDSHEMDLRASQLSCRVSSLACDHPQGDVVG